MKKLALLFLVLFSLSSQASEETPTMKCAPLKPLIGALIQDQYSAVAEMELGHAPIILFANKRTGDWVIIGVADESTGCLLYQGRGYYQYSEKKV